MSKNHGKKHRAHPAHRHSHGLGRRALLAAGGIAVLGGGALWLSGGWGDPRRGRSFSVQGGERKPVLDPLQFGHPHVRRAYAAAARHPEVLDKIYCYCQCDRPPFRHKSLLSCFTDYHGSS